MTPIQLAKYMAMPFGKHAGKKIRDLPTSYLQWLLFDWGGLSDGSLAKCVRAQWEINTGQTLPAGSIRDIRIKDQVIATPGRRKVTLRDEI